MNKTLDQKLAEIRENPASRAFILADAKDADMAFGISSAGRPYPASPDSTPAREYRPIASLHEDIRTIVSAQLVDLMLASVSTMSQLAHRERLFDNSSVTPAVRINDTTDIWLARGGRYHKSASVPFSTARIEEAQFGSLTANDKTRPVVNLGLYSMTFNTIIESDHRSLSAFHDFRAEAQQKRFNYFLEVFAPNLKAAQTGLSPEAVPAFVNDMIVRTLAGIPPAGRPLFLKIPFFGPRWLEELVHYDSTMIVGVLGGSSGTTYDAFKLLADAQKYGARLALFGRKIKDAEHSVTFIRMLRRIVDGDISPEEAVEAYHAELSKLHIAPRRSLAKDKEVTPEAAR